MVPSIFGENMLDDFFDGGFFGAHNPLYGKNARNLLKTDIREMDDSYELAVDLPGFKKDEINLDIKDGYLTVSAEKGLDKLSCRRWIRRNLLLPAKLRLNNPHKYGSGICESRRRSLFVFLIQVRTLS